MPTPRIYLLLLLGFSLPVVYSKNHYFEHYYSKYHKSSSTTEKLSSSSGSSITEEIFSTSEISPSEASSPSRQIDVFSEDDSSLEDNYKSGSHSDTTSLQHGSTYNNDLQRMFIARIAIIVGSVVFIVLCLGCVVCCCPSCCRGRQQRGVILRNNRQVPTEVHSQPVTTYVPPLQPAVAPNFPPQYAPEPMQQFPSQYPQQPAQPQPQYSPMHPGYPYSPVPPVPGYQDTNTQLQFYNPPEAPPPYESIAPEKH